MYKVACAEHQVRRQWVTGMTLWGFELSWKPDALVISPSCWMLTPSNAHTQVCSKAWIQRICTEKEHRLVNLTGYFVDNGFLIKS